MGTLYETISELCALNETKPGKMCNDLGISRGLMTDLKMGRKKGVSAETANKIANYFGVSVDYLLTGEEKENTPAESGKGIQEEDIKAAFFNGADPTLTKEDRDAMWQDAQDYFRFKIAQRRKQQENGK